MNAFSAGGFCLLTRMIKAKAGSRRRPRLETVARIDPRAYEVLPGIGGNAVLGLTRPESTSMGSGSALFSAARHARSGESDVLEVEARRARRDAFTRRKRRWRSARACSTHGRSFRLPRGAKLDQRYGQC
jgi:hypothetical protein